MPDYKIVAAIEGNAKPLADSYAKAKRGIENNPVTPGFSLGKFTSDFTKFEQSLDAATARVVAFTATTSLIYGVGSAFKRLTQDAIQIESTMTRIQAIFGSTAAETKQFQSAIFQLANDVGLSFFKVAEAAEEFSRQGLTLNKTLEATRAAAIVAKLSGAELKGVIEGLTATLSTFNDGTLDYIQVANKLVALDSAFATSAAGITEGLKRVSGVAVEAGLSFDQTAAAITSLKQVTGRSEAVIGNSLKSIFTSLQTEKIQKDLGALGVETKDASGEFRNLVDVLSDLSKVYSTLGDAQKSLIAQKIGKTYQANAFQGILKTFETGDFSKALKVSENAGSSAEDRLTKLNQTTESALQRFSNNITQLGGNLGDKLGKPLLDTVVGYMNTVITTGNKIFGDSGLGDSLINGLKSAIAGPGLLILGVAFAKLFARIIKESGQALKAVSGISGAKENILKIDTFITQNLNEQQKKELEKIKNLTSVAAQQKAILDLMNRQVIAQEKMRTQGALSRDYGIPALSSLNPITARRAARKVPNRSNGDVMAVNQALVREAIDIKNGVGGARSSAIPQVRTLNLGKGPQKVVVNSDEKVVPNFAGSGQHAVLNREMMGYAKGKLTKKQLENQQEVITKALDAEIINQKKQSTRLKNLMDLPSKGIYSGVAVPSTISTPGALTTNLGAAGLNQLNIPKEVPKYELGIGKQFPRIPKYELEKIQESRNEIFGNDLLRGLNKNLKPLEIEGSSTIAANKMNEARMQKIRALNQANAKRDRELNLYKNKQQREEFATIRDRVSPGRKGVFSNLFGNSSGFSYAGSGNSAFLQKNPFSRNSDQISARGIYNNNVTSTSSASGAQALSITSRAIAALPPNGLPQLGGNKTTGTFVTLPPLKGNRPTPAKPNFSFNTQKGQSVPSIDDGVRVKTIQDKVDAITNVIDKKGFGNLSGSARSYFKDNKNLFDQDTLDKYESGRFKNRAKRAFGNFSGEKALGIGFSTSFIGGAVAENYKTKDGEETQTSRAIGSISQGLGVGALAGTFGKLPGVIGLVAGAAVGLNDAFGENLDSLNGLSKKHEDLQGQYAKESQAIESYRQNFELLSDAISSGSSQAAEVARTNLTTALSGISSPELKSRIAGATDIRSLSKISTEIEGQRARELASSSALASVGKVRQENRKSFLSGQDILGSIPLLSLGLGKRGGNRGFAPDAAYSDISKGFIDSIDFSKFSKEDISRFQKNGFNTSDLSQENQKTLKIFSERFKGEEIILKAIERRALEEEKTTKSLENLNKVIQKTFDLSNLVSNSSQKASFSIFEKSLKSSTSNALLESSFQASRPFMSEIGAAETQFSFDKAKRFEGYKSQTDQLNIGIIDKAKELLKDQNIDSDKLGKIQGAFSSFGETGDIKTFLSSFKDVLGTGSKDLEKFVQDSFLELKKLNAEMDSSNQIAESQQRNIIEELKRGQRAAIFGGGTSRFDGSQSLPGLISLLKGPVYNKYNDPNRPGFGTDARSGRKTFSSSEFAREEEKTTNVNVDGYEAILKRIQYQKDTGYFGVEPTSDTPQAVKDLRERLLESARNDAAGAFAGIKKKFALDQGISESNKFVDAINDDSNKFNGAVAITKEQKNVIQNAIRSGDYRGAVSSVESFTSGINKNYDMSKNIEKFKDSLRLQGENYSLIEQSSVEQAKGFVPSESLEGQNIKLLTDISSQEKQANEHLSSIVSLIASQEKRADFQSREAEYNIASQEYNSLQAKGVDDFYKYNSLLPRVREFVPGINKDSGIYEVRKELLDTIRVNERAGASPDEIAKMYSLLSSLKDIKTTEEMRTQLMDKKDSLKDPKFDDVRIKNMISDSLLPTFKTISDKLESFFSGGTGKTAKVDQNVTLDINATVAGSNLLASDDFKNEMTQFVSSYISKVWKENTGKTMVTPPQMTA